MNVNEPKEVLAIRAEVRQFVDEEGCVSQAPVWDRENRVPRALIEKLALRGLCSLVVPESYGGRGRMVLAYLAVVEELARASFGLSATYAMNAGYGALSVSLLGSDWQRREFLPAIQQGRLLFAYGLSEPEVGADLASVQTTARRVGDRVVIDGVKKWTSGARDADYIHCLARTGPVEGRHRNLTMILVPTNAEGLSLHDLDIMGSGGNCPAEVRFAGVEVPAELVLGGLDSWNKGWTQLVGPTLEIEKIQPAAMAVGNAQAAVDEAWAYSQERQQFGQRICAFQSIRHQLADACTELQACRALLLQAGGLVQARLPSAVMTSMTKLFVSEATRRVVLSCQQVMGAAGYARGRHMERLVRDALLFPIIGGSSAIQRNNIANLMQLPRS